MAMIPWRWRQSWNHCVSDFNVNVQSLWRVVSRTRDVTMERQEGMDDFQSGKLSRVFAALNRLPVETVSVHECLDEETK